METMNPAAAAAFECNPKTIASEIYERIDAEKKVSRLSITCDQIENFVNTVEAISNIGRYDTTVSVNGVVYPVDLYQIDARIAQYLVKPREITMPGISPFLKDIRIHEAAEAKLTPGEFIEVQEMIVAPLKASVTLQPITQFIAAKVLGDIVEVSNGSECHVNDIVTVSAIPVRLSITDELFDKDYFEYPLKVVVQHAMINMVRELKK